MFWGLIMEPNKRYTQTVETSFHVSMASLDIEMADDEGIVQVMLCYGDRTYLLCSLKKGTIWQVPLDLNFQAGTKIAFTCNGHGHVHLTGYLIPEDDLDLDELEEEQEEIEEEEEDEQKELDVLENHFKRRAMESPKDIKDTKRVKQEVMESIIEDDDYSGMLWDENDSEDSEEEDDLVQKKQEDNDNAEDENDDKNREGQERKKKSTKLQQREKKMKQNQDQNQQKRTHDKQKLVNGKEVKQEQDKQQKNNKTEQQLQHQQNVKSEAKKRVLEAGVQVEDLRLGNGSAAKYGKVITVFYVGRLKNGKKFDANTQGNGFKFKLGKGEVVKGLELGTLGMKVGGKRRITIPPNMAYGAKGCPPAIPGNSTLTFDVELRNIY